MAENKGTRIWQWAVLLLVLCNAGLIITMWVRPHHGPPPPPHGGGPRNFIIDQLKLTDDQVKKYDVLIDAHQQAMRRLRHENDELREQLFAGLKNDQPAVADSISGLIAKNQKEIEMVTYRHFADVRALCNGEQKSAFDNIIGDVVKQMAGPGGPRPPRGDRPGPPPEDRPAHDGPPPGAN